MPTAKKRTLNRAQPTSVVTGGAGFLGSHLVDLLLARAHRVVAIDNFVTGAVQNIDHLAGNPHFKFIQLDVTEFIFLHETVDYVWHFASPASPIDYLELPIQTLKVGRVVPAFISQALRNKPLSVFGDGSQTRSFCYCSDLIEGIYRLMLSRHTEPVNLGNPHELSVLEFAREIIRVTGSRSRIAFQPLPQDDPKQRRPDITGANNWLQWSPQVPLAEGLKRTGDCFRAKVS